MRRRSPGTDVPGRCGRARCLGLSERMELFVNTASAMLVQSGRLTIQGHTEDDLYLISLVGELLEE